MEKRLPTDYFIQFWRSYQRSPQSMAGVSPVLIYLDHSDDSQKAVSAFNTRNQRFEPILGSPSRGLPTPSATFGYFEYPGLNSVLTLADACMSLDEKYTKQKDIWYPDSTPATDDLARRALMEIATQQDWAYAEAISKGRSMT